jgi:hypothetical protein
MPGADRRRFRRVPFELDARLTLVNMSLVAASGEPSVRGLVRDITPTGMMICLKQSYRIGTRFKIELRLGDDDHVFYALVRRLLPEEATAGMGYGHGFQIIGASEQAIQSLAVAVLNAGAMAQAPKDQAPPTSLPHAA